MQWNTQNTLRSNAEKTEVIFFTSRFTKTPNIEKLFIDSTVIDLTEKVRDLGVILDKNVTLTYHINETLSYSYYFQYSSWTFSGLFVILATGISSTT